MILTAIKPIKNLTAIQQIYVEVLKWKSFIRVTRAEDNVYTVQLNGDYGPISTYRIAPKSAWNVGYE